MAVDNGIKAPSNSHIIESVVITNYQDSRFDVTKIMQKLVIYEDIGERGYNYGVLTLQDDNALHINLPLIGHEWLELSIRTRVDGGALGETTLKKKYKVVSIRNPSKQKDNQNQILNLDFVSELFWLSETNRMSKSYAGMVTSDIVTDIFVNGFSAQIDVEPTIYPRNWIVPNISPFDFIYRLANESTSKDTLSTNYRFFENLDGWHFKTVELLATAEVEHRLNMNPNNVNAFDRLNMAEQIKNVHFDLNEQINGGGLGVMLDELDTIQKKVNRYEIGYNEYRATTSGINDSLLYLNEVDYNTDVHYWFQSGNQVYQTNRDSALNQRLSRRMSRALMDSSVNTVKIPGNVDIKLGSVVWLDINYNGLVDHTSSGKYLVSKIKHEIAPSEYMMTLELHKDSNIEGEKIESGISN